ncbi:MAG: ABC transporter ATP-binding protein/permease [archaeon]|nr:ABC transporter ATP-binding protein/permease [archaeon]
MSEPAKESKGGKLAPGRQAPGPTPGPPWARKEKPRNFRKALGELFRHIGRYRYLILLGVLLSMTGSVLTTLGPQYLKDMSDEIYRGIDSGMDMQVIGSLAFIIIALYLASVVFNTLEHYIIPATSERIANLLRRELVQKINRLPLNYYDNSSTGDIMSRITHDADTIGDSCGHSISLLLTSITTLVSATVLMFMTNVTLSLVTIIPTVIGFLVMRVITSRSHKYFVAQSRNLGAINGHVEETYYGHDIVRAYNGEEASRERFMEINDALYRSAYTARFISGTLPQLMFFISNLGYVLVCIFGSMLVIQGSITYGVIVAFIVYVRMFSHPLVAITDAVSSMQTLAASSERVFDLLNAPEMEDESSKADLSGKVRGDIEFRDVSFSYIEGHEIIHHFSLKVAAGQKVAIVGPTGAGKTTIVNLLMRFYEVDSGDILIDGVSTRDIRRSRVHEMFSMVLQDAWVFDGTVRENLVFNGDEVSEERIVAACRAVGVHDFISSLPEGYDTPLNETSGLSVGQRQQLMIARAIIRDGPMIIFDEATSSVDTRTEKVIQKAVDDLTDGRTSFFIAHRLSTIRNCDVILVMRDGRIVETGTHEELLAAGGFYSELYNSQFENCD